MTWSQADDSGYTFSKDTALTPTNSLGLHRRATTSGSTTATSRARSRGNYATAYTHFTNSWEFTGATQFDNVADQTATIVAPQTNIEMGSFTDPTRRPARWSASSWRATSTSAARSTVDGSIIVTGDGAGNTTLGYFGASDGDTDAGADARGRVRPAQHPLQPQPRPARRHRRARRRPARRGLLPRRERVRVCGVNLVNTRNRHRPYRTATNVHQPPFRRRTEGPR